jgi:hypothetical protein
MLPCALTNVLTRQKVNRLTEDTLHVQAMRGSHNPLSPSLLGDKLHTHALLTPPLSCSAETCSQVVAVYSCFCAADRMKLLCFPPPLAACHFCLSTLPAGFSTPVDVVTAHCQRPYAYCLAQSVLPHSSAAFTHSFCCCACKTQSPCCRLGDAHTVNTSSKLLCTASTSARVTQQTPLPRVCCCHCVPAGHRVSAEAVGRHSQHLKHAASPLHKQLCSSSSAAFLLLSLCACRT